MQIKNGWLSNTEICPSPNYNARPPNTDISLIVIHNISLPPGQFGNGCVAQFFRNELDHDQHPYFDSIRGLHVSAHCFIDRKGMIQQFVSFLERAWHAGRSSFDGLQECNDYSIGVELEGTDDQAFTENQYRSLCKLAKVLMLEFPAIAPSRITGHSVIAPDRKTDPGPAFDWKKLHLMLEQD